MRGRWLAIAAVAAQMVACQAGAETATSPAGSSTPVAQQSPSTTGLGTNPSSAVPTAAIKCMSPLPTNHPLALVNLRGIEGAVVQDLADFNHPSTVCSIPACANSAGCQTIVKALYVNPLFAGPGRLSYWGYDESGFALFVFDMRTGSVSTVLASHAHSTPSSEIAWSADGTQLTYL